MNSYKNHTLLNPDFSMWKRAATAIPRVREIEQWHALDSFSRWLISTRAAVLLMTLFAAVIAGIYAQYSGHFDWVNFSLLAVGLILAHATNNILNDLTDHRKGVDKDNAFRTLYGTQPVEDGFMTQSQSLRMALITGLLGSLAGLYLVYRTGYDVLPFFLAGLVLVFAYNWPLKHFGLGEPTVVLVWGPLMIGGGYLAITGEWSWAVAIASLPYAFGPTTVLFGKHIDKIPWDRPKGVRTLPVLMGEKASRITVMILFFLQYSTVVYLVIAGFFAWPVLAVFGVIPFLVKTLRIFSKPTPEECPADYPKDAWPLWFSSHAFVHNRKFGGLFLLGLLIQMIWF